MGVSNVWTTVVGMQNPLSLSDTKQPIIILKHATDKFKKFPNLTLCMLGKFSHFLVISADFFHFLKKNQVLEQF